MTKEPLLKITSGEESPEKPKKGISETNDDLPKNKSNIHEDSSVRGQRAAVIMMIAGVAASAVGTWTVLGLADTSHPNFNPHISHYINQMTVIAEKMNWIGS